MASPQREPKPAREYWIEADSFERVLVPTGLDPMMNVQIPPDQSKIWALGYRAYTPNWEKLLPASEDIGSNDGIPGPVIRAKVGETILVHFRNNDSHYKFPHSMHFHGFKYESDSDGTYLASVPDRPDGAVKFGESYTYRLTAAESSVGTWAYHDHSAPQRLPGTRAINMGVMDSDDTPGMTPRTGMVNMPMASNMEINAELGMMGIAAVTGKDTPKVDKEFFVLFHDIYAADVPGIATDFDCINGHSYLGNTPTFTARKGQRIRWRVVTIGKEFHVFHIHGHRWKSGNEFVDGALLGPATSATIEYVEDSPGDWLYHCHVPMHMAGGMIGRYVVDK